MTKLNCCVTSCNYNEDNRCCLGKILVEGGQAHVPSATCCDSFIERGSLTNSEQTPQESLVIECRAAECVHNDRLICEAEHISIVGQGASRTDETQCNTFCKK